MPFVFIPGYFHNQLLETPLVFSAFALGMIPATFIIHWAWFKTNRSILGAIVFRFAFNFFGELIQIGDIARIIQNVLLGIFAIALVLYDKNLFFNQKFTIDELKLETSKK
ncbi:hypothetical protein [Candidatus Contubernalis alkaliaceticus]|uniref:hypothetical protein n=1 Tax=Candidatus Contubernalis alkaliaceticus TaxID=338645 RepID=UPI001F4C476A|nr:hypothetical protein [Candidatus Contubernalis alkalaceticus]UNC92179.1 hypothetical protein HUE98_08790 [Candidatus Contubernalis alkalaceticus]